MSASAALAERSPGKFELTGTLTFATARGAREAGLTAFGASSSRELQVDCGAVTAADSAGMAVLLDWMSFAKQSGRSLRYGRLPAQMQALARICEVLDLLEQGV
ncbi:MAG TPA: STAS domain-containing protein [Steroidobacteraceae bacterium]|nr:STAS domain-containing protein [Steroidobacteraceae bacterium]